MTDAVETDKMNIDEELNKIIFKYNLDRYYPHYRNKYESEKILRNIVNEIIQYSRKVLFVGNDCTGIDFIKTIARDYEDIHFCFYNRSDKKFQQLAETNWEEYNKVYLISFYGSEHIERWFRQHNIRYEWIYDIFESRGVILQREFYAFGKEDIYNLIAGNGIHNSRKGLAESILCELYCQQSKYDNSDDNTTKRIALEKCLFLALYMRNFVAAQRYISLLSKYDECFASLWEEIQALLNDIKNILSDRKQKDIILYWIDAIPYGDEKDMTYLQSIMHKSVAFDNAFTYIPNTHPTLRAMFLGKRDIDDRNYNISKITGENSPLIQFLEAHGYGVKIFTGYFTRSFPTQYWSERLYMDWFDTASMKLWDVLSGMVSGEQKKLWVVHMMEAHHPCINSRLNDNNYRNANELYKLARLEIDEQLAFYDSFMNDDSFRIFMSDHGRGEDAIHTDKRLRFHILFNIYNKKLTPRRIKGLFSLLDFGTVLKQIIEDSGINEESFLREYVEVCCLDRYSGNSIAELLNYKSELTLNCFGLKGIVDKEYIYVRYKTGREWLQKRSNIPLINPWLFYDHPDDICETGGALTKYRELAGEFPEYMDSDDKFKYSKYLYKLYNNILSHNDLPRRIGIINSILSGYPDDSVGIRMGGKHSLVLYSILSKENRKKIWGFIDNNKECLCSNLNLPIISSDQIQNFGQGGKKAVLLSSYDYRDVLKAESENYSNEIDVLDIYDFLEKEGIHCEYNFWVVKGADEDYDVGYPFDEIYKS